MDNMKILGHEKFERLGLLALKEILEHDVATLLAKR
jgi:hypothetical protein